MNRTDRIYEKGGHRKAEIRFSFPEWPTAEITGTHIRELTRFQREIRWAAPFITVELTPGVSHRENVWSPRDLPVFRNLSFTLPSCHSRNERTLFDRPFGQQNFYQNFKKFFAWYDKATLTKSLLISKLRACQSPPPCLTRMPMLTDEKSVERPNDLHLIIFNELTNYLFFFVFLPPSLIIISFLKCYSFPFNLTAQLKCVPRVAQFLGRYCPLSS